MGASPTFLVIGAQKSASTALFRYLSKHPQLFLPPQKEIGFFSDERLYAKGFQWYTDTYFAKVKEGIHRGEVSPQYMCYQKVPQRIMESLPGVKLIAILRNPIDRAYSHFKMAVRRNFENRAFSSAVRASVSRGIVADEEVDEQTEYYQFGLYGRILAEYVRCFSLQNIEIKFQEQMDAKPEQALSEVFRFLGVDPSFVPDNLGVRYHVGGVKRFARLEKLLSYPNPLKSCIKPMVPETLRRSTRFWFEQYNIKPVYDNGPSKEEREYLKEVFQRDVASLEDMFKVQTPWDDFA